MFNMPTPLGKELRKLRIDSGERIFDLAEALGVTSSFISALELGKKSVPAGFVDKVAQHYQMDDKSVRRLRKLADVSAKMVPIQLAARTDTARELAFAFARAFPQIGDDQARELIGQLDPKGKEEE